MKAGHDQEANFLCEYFGLFYEERCIRHIGEPPRVEFVIYHCRNPGEKLEAQLTTFGDSNKEDSNEEGLDELKEIKEKLAQFGQKLAQSDQALIQTQEKLASALKESTLKSPNSKYRLLEATILAGNLALVKLVCQELQLTKSDLFKMPNVLSMANRAGGQKMVDYLLTTYEI